MYSESRKEILEDIKLMEKMKMDLLFNLPRDPRGDVIPSFGSPLFQDYVSLCKRIKKKKHLIIGGGGERRTDTNQLVLEFFERRDA